MEFGSRNREYEDRISALESKLKGLLAWIAEKDEQWASATDLTKKVDDVFDKEQWLKITKYQELELADKPVSMEEWAANGFENRTDSSLAFDDATRTFTISGTYSYWHDGIEYESTGDTLVITDVTGIHMLYYDADTLTEIVNPTVGEVSQTIRNEALVSIIYWNSTDAEGIYVGEERHGKVMSPDTHAYLHFTQGLAYLNGLGLNTLSVDDVSVTNASAQFGVDTGTVADEDVIILPSAVTSTTGLNTYYQDANGWHVVSASGYSVIKTGTVGEDRLAYNQFTGGNWQLTEVTNGRYVLCHVFATTEKDNPMIAIVGQNEYSSKLDARSGATTEILSLVLDDVLFPEIRAVATVIFETRDSYGTTMNARVISTEEGDDYIDWRNEVVSRTALSTSDHGSLTGLGDDDHTQYLPTDGSREADIIAFDTTATATPAEGELNWNSDDGTLQIGMPGGDVVLQIGEEHIVKVKNETGSTVNNGDVVYVSGATGQRPTIGLADADDPSTCMILGLATEQILNNALGFVTIAGLVRDIDTSSFSAGNTLWVSQTAGDMTATRPTQPACGAVVGVCLYSHATEGIVLVAKQVYPNIDDLSDVIVSSVADGEALTWDAATSTWQNTAISSTSDKIEEGDSSVEVIDAGTGGVVKNTIDGSLIMSVDDAGVNIETGYGYRVNNVEVVSSQQGAISDVSTGGGTDQDDDARDAINSILSALRGHGLIAT